MAKISLSELFTRTTLAERDKAMLSPDISFNLSKLIVALNYLRDKVNCPIIVNSGYRDAYHNDAVGGVPGSQHMFGQAADIWCYDENDMDRIVEIICTDDFLRSQFGQVIVYKTHDFTRNPDGDTRRLHVALRNDKHNQLEVSYKNI